VSCAAQAGDHLLGPEIVGRRATLTIALDDQKSRIVQGVIETMAVMASITYDEIVYRFRLSPGVCRLKGSRHNHIYGTIAPVSVVDVLRSELSGDLRRGSPADDSDRPVFQYDLRLFHTYPSWDHLTQFEETDFDFTSRLAEHYGIFYFFENAPTTERIVFTDYNLFASRLEEPSVLPYAPDPNAPDRDGVLRTFEAVYAAASNKVFLQDYNDELPHLPLLASKTIDQDGHGNWVEYGDHYRTPAEGEFLARVRAEELGCARTRFKGTSTVVRLAPGRTFQAAAHPFGAWNREYLVISVRHRIKVALGGAAAAAERQRGEYANEFTAIPSDTPFRPARRTARPRIDGLINGRVEGNGVSEDPNIDSLGRYRVRLPFDLSGTPGGFGSQWMRKVEPYGGPDNGMHFPLPPGANVLVAFVNGDPDRPVIVGALPAADNLSVVTGESRQHNRITTRSGIVFTLADQMAKAAGGGI
jgi:type VI secretion system VgrG family protein